MNPVTDFLDELELLGRSINTIKTVKKILKNFQESCDGKDVLKVDEDNIKVFIQNMRRRKIAEKTLNDYVKTVERFYDFVVESNKYGVALNPVKRLSKKLRNKKQQTKRPIKTLDEIAKLIKDIHNPRDRAIVVLLAKTAIRNGELGALNIDDIDFDNETININKHIANDHNNESARGRKNGIETIIPLDDETIRALKFYILARPTTKDRALFISFTGFRLYPTDITRIVKEWAIKTGACLDTTETEKKIVPHFFRAWATYTLQINGLNPSIVDYIRGDTANTIRGFYFNQVLPLEVIKKEYLRCVPKFGI